MPSRLLDAKRDTLKRDILTSAAEVAATRNGSAGLDPDATCRLLQLYYRHTAPEDIVERNPVDILGAAMSSYRLALHRPQGTSAMRVFTPTVQDNEWTADGHSVVEIVTDDMPFLVDSVTMALTAESRSIHVVIHPLLVVSRDLAGHLQHICDGESPSRHDEPCDMGESWMHIEIDRESDPTVLRALQERLTRTLSDVREAVEDWNKMRDQAQSLVSELTTAPPPLPEAEVSEGRALLEWLADDHFTFLGYREYQLGGAEGAEVLRAVPGTGLGILRSDQDMSPAYGKLPPTVAAKAREKQLLIITKANSRSTVHRPAYLDYVGMKRFDTNGEVVGERRFLGLFSSAAYTESLLRIPVLRVKARQVVDAAGFAPRSHSGKTLMDILETYPRDELFQTSVEELVPVALAVLHLRERRQLRFFARRDAYGRYLSCLVYLPRDRYTTHVRERIQSILTTQLGAASIDYTARVSESVLARLHFVVRAAPGETLRDFDEAALEQQLADATRSWTDDLVASLTEQYGEEIGAKLARNYANAFPEAYKEDFRPSMGAIDVHQLEQVDPGSIGLSLYSPVDAAESEARFKVFRTGSPLSLSMVLPILSAMGVEVVDERPYELERPTGRAWIYDFGLRRATGFHEGMRDTFQDSFMAVWRGLAESDGFSALVLSGGLHWRQVAVLRAYAKYFRQGGSPFGQAYIASSLVANVPITQLLVALFETRFDPDADLAAGADDQFRLAARHEQAEGIERSIRTQLDGVASLDQDRILRSYLGAIKATLRTNFYQTAAGGGQPRASITLKLDPTELPDVPEPRPKYEIFVYSPRVEGVHLRFGPVARGGLRWSDRREDFRTEVLGLVKAQMVKNAVIVPVGAKGGFYCKKLPPAGSDRETELAEGIECYQIFIRGMLDVTDNLVAGETVPPARVVRHDGDDSYLVVAADKGPATFSDIANSVAHEYGFWLGDAFASGGSVGYDHKAMGITARGAWESVRRHFRERGVDTQSQDFTCVGIGDMSGDVFGNGMLLSKHIRLVAAFDHRHIFLDPTPNAAASYAERRRLFELPRSSWADYDPALISAGGGVFSRQVKSIPVTAEVVDALGLESGTTKLPPAELMRAILLAPVDLLWNGGIGTYVKSSAETSADVGDRANDAIRVDGDQLRCQVVGEGGNLGLTQRGRVEFALGGGRICTDFIDNSAGVDTSDHEVNIKILLDRVVQSGDLTVKQRNELLASMTDEVAALVLADNYGQNLALASAARVAPGLIHVHGEWVRRLEKRGLLDRQLEFIPSVKEFETRRAAGVALAEPELAVLLAYTKIVLAAELLNSGLPDDPFLRTKLFGYFPSKMRQQFRGQMQAHPLRREIIVTKVVNDLVNFAGITFFHRLSQETGANAEELARAQLVCREIYAADLLLQQINCLDNAVDAAVQTELRLAVRTLIERASRWMINNRRPLDSEATVDHFGTDLQQLVKALPDVLIGVQAAEFARRRDELTAVDVPVDLATAIAVLPPAYAALEVVEIARRDGVDALEVARVHATLAERLRLSALTGRIAALPRDDRWQTMARAALRDDLYAVHAALTAQVLSSTDPGLSAAKRVAAWEHHDAAVVNRAAETLAEITSDDASDLARMSVGLGIVRTLLSAA